jgi:hypothetical protein
VYVQALGCVDGDSRSPYHQQVASKKEIFMALQLSDAFMKEIRNDYDQKTGTGNVWCLCEQNENGYRHIAYRVIPRMFIPTVSSTHDLFHHVRV